MSVHLAVYQPYGVPFHEDTITCIDRDDSMFVALRPTCEAIGLPYVGQEQRLQRAKWATVCKMHTVAADGKNREMTFIDRRTFALWLATIDADKVSDEAIRPKIERYQREAADVLDRHFFGGRSVDTRPIPTEPTADLNGIEFVKAVATGLLEMAWRHEEQGRQFVAFKAEVAKRCDTIEHKADAALARSGDTGFMTVLGYLRLNRLFFPRAEMARIGLWLYHYCQANGLRSSSVPDEKFGTVNAWPREALDAWRATLPIPSAKQTSV